MSDQGEQMSKIEQIERLQDELERMQRQLIDTERRRLEATTRLDEVMEIVTKKVHALWDDCDDAKELGESLGIDPPITNWQVSVTIELSMSVTDWSGSENDLRDELEEAYDWDVRVTEAEDIEIQSVTVTNCEAE